MKKFFGYVRTLRNYLHSPKGSHDFKDYARALVIILLTALIIFLVVSGQGKKLFPFPLSLFPSSP